MTSPSFIVVLVSVLICSSASVRALNASDAKEIARRTADSANDEAVTVEARQEALQKLEDASRLYLSIDEKLEAARILNRVGHLQLILNAPSDALDSYDRALGLLKQFPSTETEVDSLNGLGESYLLGQKREQAEEALHKALMLSEQSGYTRGQAQALLTLSDSQNYQDHVVALQTAQQALVLWKSLDDKAGVARTHSQIGRCYLAQNLLPESTQNYQEALRLWRELSNLSEQAEALIMLGFIEFRKGEWQSSISLLTQAEGLLDEKAEPVKMGQIEAQLGEAFNERGLPELGITHFEKALDYFRQAQDLHGIRQATLGLGETYYLLGEYEEALTQFQQVLDGVGKKAGLDAATSYEYLGRVRNAMGDAATALKYLQQALAIYAQSANPTEAARVRALMGQAYQQQGRLGPARQEYQQALQEFIGLSDSLNQASVYYMLGRLDSRSGNLDGAEDYFRQSIETTEKVRRVPTSSDLTAAFSATIHDRYQNYIECLMLKDRARPAQGFGVRAFETSELARARSLADMLRATQTNLLAGLDRQLAEREKFLRQSLRVKEDYKIALLGKAYKKEELEALDGELTRLENEYQQITEIIRQRYPAYEQVNRPTATDLRQIQEHVIADNETVLLEYSLGEERSFVWAVTRNNFFSTELPAKKAINEPAQKVYELLAVPPSEETEKKLGEAARELSQMILSPLAAELKKRRIIVVADGILNYIPFQSLPMPSANSEQMVAEHEVINAPSASVLEQLRQESAQRQPSERVLAAFGDPVFASNYAQRKDPTANAEVVVAQNQVWQHALRDIEIKGDSFDRSTIQPLFYAKRELANLRDVAGSATLVATGFDASRESLESANLTKYAILHFATHGILDPKHPENSGLFLSMVDRDGKAQNGFFSLQDIYGLHAPVELVVLSACRTGLGKEVRGEGLIGLTRGFMYAGASSVVASLWKVDDEATAELMKRFYANMLQRAMTPAAALRAAQNSIRQEPQWHSPYYWAAFTLQGDYRQLIKPPAKVESRYAQMGLGGALLMLLAVTFWYRHHRRRRLA